MSITTTIITTPDEENNTFTVRTIKSITDSAINDVIRQHRRVDRDTPISETARRMRAIRCVVSEFEHHVIDGETMVALFDSTMNAEDQQKFGRVFEQASFGEKLNSWTSTISDVGANILMTRRHR